MHALLGTRLLTVHFAAQLADVAVGDLTNVRVGLRPYCTAAAGGPGLPAVGPVPGAPGLLVAAGAPASGSGDFRRCLHIHGRIRPARGQLLQRRARCKPDSALRTGTTVAAFLNTAGHAVFGCALSLLPGMGGQFAYASGPALFLADAARRRGRARGIGTDSGPGDRGADWGVCDRARRRAARMGARAAAAPVTGLRPSGRGCGVLQPWLSKQSACLAGVLSRDQHAVKARCCCAAVVAMALPVRQRKSLLALHPCCALLPAVLSPWRLACACELVWHLHRRLLYLLQYLGILCVFCPIVLQHARPSSLTC